MPIRSERIVPIQATSQKSSHASQTNLDLDIFGAKEIRDVLKSRTHCLRAGFPTHHVIISTLNEIRNHYILKVGLPTYLSQMLGEVGQVEIQYCSLYGEDEQRLEVSLNKPHQPLQRFIKEHFHWDELPFRIEICKDPNSDHIEVRYL